MDQPGAMRRGQTFSCTKERLEDLRLAAPPLFEPSAQCLPVDELHGNEHGTAEQTDIVNRDHVRVLQARQCLSLPQESLAAGRAIGRLQELERDHSVEFGIVGLVDHAHPALAEQVEQHVSPD